VGVIEYLLRESAKNLLGKSVGMLAQIRQANDHNSAWFRHVKETKVGFSDQQAANGKIPFWGKKWEERKHFGGRLDLD
jgi:hypothetical protein